MVELKPNRYERVRPLLGSTLSHHLFCVGVESAFKALKTAAELGWDEIVESFQANQAKGK